MGRDPLSIDQLALWQEGTAGRHVHAAVRCSEPLDAAALERALRGLVDRHAALRTAVREEHGEPYQVPIPDPDVALVVEDAAALDGAALRARLADEAAGERLSPAAGRMLQALLLRRPDGDVLSLAVHPLSADERSLALIVDELGRRYAAERGGGPAPDAPPVPEGGELARRQRAMLAGPRGERLWEFWRAALDGCRTLVELPTDRPRPRRRWHVPGAVPLRMEPGLTGALRGLAAREGTTLFVALLTVLQALVHRYSAADDLLVAVPGLVDPDLSAAVGRLANPVLVRSQVIGRRAFVEQLRVTKRAVEDALAHQELPLSLLVQRFGLWGLDGQSPGHQVTFSLTPGDEPAASLPAGPAAPRMRFGDLEVVPLGRGRPTSEADLSVGLLEEGDHLEGAIAYATDLFDQQTIVRLGEHLRRLAWRLARAPEEPLGAAPLATDEERRLFAVWNSTATDYPRERTVCELFADQVRSRPDGFALTFGATSFTYRELDRVSNALACRLRDLGVGPEARVALYLDRDVGVIVAMLAVAKAGGAYVPLDPSHPPLRLRQVIHDSSPCVVLTRSDARPDGLGLGVPLLDVDEVLVREVAGDPAHDDGPQSGVRPDGVLYVMYTSGSTGEPKGICVVHRNVVRLVRDTNYFTLAPGDRMAQISNAAFDAVTLEVWGALLNGGHLIGFDRTTVLAPARLAEALRTSGIHTLVAATALFQQVVVHDPRTFASTRQLLIGGDAMDPKRARDVVALCGPALVNGYGPTESTTFATTHRVTSVPDDTWRIPIGAPIANTQVHVLDALLQPQPIGVPGQLHIGGDGLARCYLRRPDLTAERFLPDPFSDRPGCRMYATGDMARWLPGGVVDFLGRTDFQVKVRGFRIELAEIDAVVLRHPTVAEAATVLEGEMSDDRRLVCYYAGPPADAPAADDLAGFVRARLPEYMVPVRFVALDELPKNPNRKVDRARLPSMVGAPVTAPADPGLSAEEHEVAEMLAGLLSRPQVGPDENFFEIGGHSLLAIRLVNRLRERYGVEMELEDLFDDATARGIAAYVRRRAPVGPVDPR